MQRAPCKALETSAVITLGGLLIAGIGFDVVGTKEEKAVATEAAQDYTPPVTYTPPPVPIEVAFLGDSFTAGSGADNRVRRWTTQLSRENGWLELNYGFGGTNYSTGGKLKGGKPYSERLTDLIVSQPDIIIVSSAGNDLGTDQTPGIRETFRELRRGLPEARIIATSPYYRAWEMPPPYEHFAEDIRREVEAVGGEYVDIGHPLKGHPEGMSKDKIHPNDIGYSLIADAVSEALGETA